MDQQRSNLEVQGLLLNPSSCAQRQTNPTVRVYCKGRARSTGSLCSKDPNSPTVFREEVLKANFRGRVAGGMTCFWLAGGECSAEVPVPTWVGGLIPAEELRGVYQIVVYSHWGRNSDSALLLLCCFLTAFPLFLSSFTSLVNNRLNLLLWNSGKAYKQEPGDTERLLYLGGHEVLLNFSSN